MTREEFFRIIPARQFFKIYCPEVSNFYHKLRGLDGNKKPIDFSAEEKQLMNKAAKKIIKDIEGVNF
jgi:hypothetical protein